MVAVTSIVVDADVDRPDLRPTSAWHGTPPRMRSWPPAPSCWSTAQTGLMVSPRSGSMSTSGGTPETATMYVTVIIDLTPTRTRTGPSRLLAVVEGRSKQAFKS